MGGFCQIMNHFLVAIDGPAGAGKSTIAKQVAEALGVLYIDTGAMYRAIAFKSLKNQIDMQDVEAIVQLAKSTSIQMDRQGIYLDGLPVSDELRSLEVSRRASEVARISGIRSILVEMQQTIAKDQGVVMDGRDIGTVVLPHAHVKIFLTASIEQRAKRRLLELRSKGEDASLEELMREIHLRDENDQTREIAPLRQTEDAIRIDTTDQSIDEVAQQVVKLCHHRQGGVKNE